jgi:hypothetical protein
MSTTFCVLRAAGIQGLRFSLDLFPSFWSELCMLNVLFDRGSFRLQTSLFVRSVSVCVILSSVS